MALLEFIGCTLVAFGPSISMFCITIATCPIRVVIFITAAFFWLVSLLLSSIVWCSTVAIVKPTDQSKLLAFGMVQAVCFQELFRFLFYRILRKADAGLRKMVEVGSDSGIVFDSRQTTAYVSGLGFGTISGGFSILNVLAAIVGPASVGLFNQSEWFVLVSSSTACMFILLNTAWGVILFHAYDTKNRTLIVGTLITHLVCSLITLFNMSEYYAASIPPIFIITVVSAVVAFRCAGGRFDRLRSVFSRTTTSQTLTD